MKLLLCALLVVTLCGCVPIGIRAQNLPFAGVPATSGLA